MIIDGNDVAEWKIIRIPCKQCAREFDFVVALDFYEALRAAAEEDGEDVVFTGTCPECKAETEDPFLQLMNEAQARMNERAE
jgi:UDP-N-acetyl-D-mannosaminuronic acid transferase (WecB/TagA/CpsF family)